jgi:hypothetical protein
MMYLFQAVRKKIGDGKWKILSRGERPVMYRAAYYAIVSPVSRCGIG